MALVSSKFRYFFGSFSKVTNPGNGTSWFVSLDDVDLIRLAPVKKKEN